jgi:hypothetical protein
MIDVADKWLIYENAFVTAANHMKSPTELKQDTVKTILDVISGEHGQVFGAQKSYFTHRFVKNQWSEFRIKSLHWGGNLKFKVTKNTKNRKSEDFLKNNLITKKNKPGKTILRC